MPLYRVVLLSFAAVMSMVNPFAVIPAFIALTDRVDSRRKITDFPPAGLNTDGVPTGGWWNYSGIQREVYSVGTYKHRGTLANLIDECLKYPNNCVVVWSWRCIRPRSYASRRSGR